MHSYSAMTSKEITFVKGDIITVFARPENGWWFGSVVSSNYAGFFPRNFCNSVMITSNELSVNSFAINESNGRNHLETEIFLLKQQLAFQQSLLQYETAKRQKLEKVINNHVDSLDWLLSPLDIPLNE